MSERNAWPFFCVNKKFAKYLRERVFKTHMISISTYVCYAFHANKRVYSIYFIDKYSTRWISCGKNHRNVWFSIGKPKSPKRRPHLLMCAHVIGENFKRLATFEIKASNKQAKFNAKTGFSNVTLQIRRFCMRFVWISVSISLIIWRFFLCSLLYFQIKFKFWIFCNPHIDIREFCDFIL